MILNTKLHFSLARACVWGDIAPSKQPGPISLKGAHKETLHISKGGQDKTQKLALAPQLG